MGTGALAQGLGAARDAVVEGLPWTTERSVFFHGFSVMARFTPPPQIRAADIVRVLFNNNKPRQTMWGGQCRAAAIFWKHGRLLYKNVFEIVDFRMSICTKIHASEKYTQQKSTHEKSTH